MRRLLLALAFVLLATPSFAQLEGLHGAFDAPVAGTERRTVTIDGKERFYLVHVPANAAGALPVVLSFHGLLSDAQQEEHVTGFSVMADREHFIAVYPEGLHRMWHVFGGTREDVDFVPVLLDDIARDHAIDRKRIYATGISNGAQMSWRLACDLPHVIAAVGMVSGGYIRVCGADRPPAILFHGTADRLLPYDGPRGMMKVRDFAARWGGAPGCGLDETHGTEIYRKGDATGEEWHCGRYVAQLYTLEGKGHSWPGSAMPARITSHDVDASVTIWRFFVAVTERGQAAATP